MATCQEASTLNIFLFDVSHSRSSCRYKIPKELSELIEWLHSFTSEDIHDILSTFTSRNLNYMRIHASAEVLVLRIFSDTRLLFYIIFYVHVYISNPGTFYAC